MIVKIKLTPNSKVEKIERVSSNELNIKIREKPIEGKANKALIKLLADYFHTSKSRIRIVRGLKSRKKIVEIN